MRIKLQCRATVPCHIVCEYYPNLSISKIQANTNVDDYNNFSIFKEVNSFSMNASLPFGPLENAEYIIAFFLVLCH